MTNHVLAGTLAGTAFRRRPVAAFCLGLATHVVMDLTPHWGNPTLGRDGFYAVAKRDGLLGLATMAVATAAGVPPRRALVAGMLGAAVLDADKPCQYLLGFNPWPPWLDRFHNAIQNESPEGIRVEVVSGIGLALVSAAVLARRRRSSRVRPG